MSEFNNDHLNLYGLDYEKRIYSLEKKVSDLQVFTFVMYIITVGAILKLLMY